MAGLFLRGRRRFGGRRYSVVIEVTHAGGPLADDLREMLTAEVSIPGVRGDQDVAVVVSPERASILIVSAAVEAANPRAALALVDEALDRALMTIGLFEEFDVTGKVLRVAPLEQAFWPGSQPGQTRPTAGER